MRVAVVVQRYGEDILGGAERHARQVAERLAERHDVTILTSCAQDYTTWENHYPPGESQVNGVRVLRFPTTSVRPANISLIWDQAFHQYHTLADELAWVRAQGPCVPALLDDLRQHRDDYSVFIYFTYLYYPTALGLRLVADKALLIPTAHDEAALYLNIYQSLFHAPRAILYNTEEERRIVERQFGNSYLPNAVVGVGVDVPEVPKPQRFRDKFGLTQPYFLYLGRIVKDKGCDELAAFYQHYQHLYPGEAALVLIGRGDLPLPEVPGLIRAGYVDDSLKYDAIAGAQAVIVPSRYESMSLIALEAWMLGRPVVCTAYSAVVRGLTQRAQGGLYYGDAEEFSEILHRLVTDQPTAHALGQQGRQFTQVNFQWPEVMRHYHHFIDYVAQHPWA
jgi:glycosyltransferase involved in cell wall biosynthesis